MERKGGRQAKVLKGNEAVFHVIEHDVQRE